MRGWIRTWGPLRRLLKHATEFTRVCMGRGVGGKVTQRLCSNGFYCRFHLEEETVGRKEEERMSMLPHLH